MDDVQPLFEDGLADLINHLEEYGVKKLGSFRAKASRQLECTSRHMHMPWQGAALRPVLSLS